MLTGSAGGVVVESAGATEVAVPVKPGVIGEVSLQAKTIFPPVRHSIAIGIGKFAYDLTKGDFSETALIGFLGGALLWSVGLLADQIARVGLRGGAR